MKISGLYLISLFFVLTCLSCDDSVDPKTAFAEKYVLNCIINLDTTFQVATVSKTFDVAGYDPNTNTNDPFIKDAIVQLFYNDSVYTMKDTSKIRTDTSKYKTALPFYYTNKLKKAQLPLPIYVKATMPDGTILFGSTYMYLLSRFYIGSSKKEITAPPLGTGASSDKITFSWGDVYASDGYLAFYYSPELVILYSHDSNGITKNLEKKVALYYSGANSGNYPVYPTIASHIEEISFLSENIKKALEEISENDPQKENYRIKEVLFRLLMMDSNLAAYYSTQKTFFDEFSVRVNQPDFSNVTNGLGIVGAYSVSKLRVKINPDYVSSFGYKY